MLAIVTRCPHVRQDAPSAHAALNAASLTKSPRCLLSPAKTGSPHLEIVGAHEEVGDARAMDAHDPLVKVRRLALRDRVGHPRVRHARQAPDLRAHASPASTSIFCTRQLAPPRRAARLRRVRAPRHLRRPSRGHNRSSPACPARPRWPPARPPRPSGTGSARTPVKHIAHAAPGAPTLCSAPAPRESPQTPAEAFQGPYRDGSSVPSPDKECS